jgi:NhaP-type Na+/H+ or K+/H+ antiporter
MNKITQWYWNNRTEITWFVIGTCTITGIVSMAAGNYVNGGINLGIAYLNYVLNKR